MLSDLKDYLIGGEGDDVYIFNKGDGEDVIEEANGSDTIQFGAGIKPDDVVAKVIGDSIGGVNLELLLGVLILNYLLKTPMTKLLSVSILASSTTDTAILLNTK